MVVLQLLYAEFICIRPKNRPIWGGLDAKWGLIAFVTWMKAKMGRKKWLQA